MALTHEITYTTTGIKSSINLDPSIAPFNANVAVALISGTVAFSLEFSLSGVDVADANAIWFTSTDFPLASAASKVAPINAPVSRVRLNIAMLAGVVTLQVLQGFTIN